MRERNDCYDWRRVGRPLDYHCRLYVRTQTAFFKIPPDVPHPKKGIGSTRRLSDPPYPPGYCEGPENCQSYLPSETRTSYADVTLMPKAGEAASTGAFVVDGCLCPLILTIHHFLRGPSLWGVAEWTRGLSGVKCAQPFFPSAVWDSSPISVIPTLLTPVQ